MKLKHLGDLIAKKYQPLTSEEKIVLIIDQDRFSFFEKQLRDTVAITQIDPEHAALVARALNPATQYYRLINMFDAKLSAGVCPMHTVSGKL